MRRDLLEHDPSAVIRWEVGDTRANRGKRDRTQPSLTRKLEAAPGRTAQAFSRSTAAQAHARRVDDKAGFELAAPGDRRATDLDRANRVALRLDGRTAAPGNGNGHAATENQVVIRGVDDGVDILLGEVALQDIDPETARVPGHPVGWTCQAIEAIRASTSARVIGCSPFTLKCWIAKDAITMA